MPSTFTSALALEKQATGENNNTWGTNLNAVLDQIDKAIATRLAKSVAGSSDVTLTSTEALNMFHEYTGTLTGNINVIVPASDKVYIVHNNTSGAFTLTVKTSAGTGIAVPQGQKMLLYCDGTDVIRAVDYFSGVPDATARDEFVAMGQIQDGDGVYAADTGAADAYAIAPTPAITAYAAGQWFAFKAANANTGASTLDVSSLGTKSILWPDGTALSAGDIPANAIVEVRYDGTQFLLKTVAQKPGTAAYVNTGTSSGQVPLMDSVGYPAANGSQITNIPFPRGFIDGLVLANGTDADHDINIAAGKARDSGDAANMTNSATLTKQIDAPWAVGSAAGGNDQAQLDGAQTVTFTDNGASDDFVTIDSGTWTVTPSAGDTLVVVGGTNAGSYQITAATTTQIDVPTGSFTGDVNSASAIYTVKAGTWYHVWLIRRSDTGVVDALFSESATAPTMPTNYDQKRRIGAVLTDGTANIIPFFQHGNRFRWDVAVSDYAQTNPGTSAVLVTLTVPPVTPDVHAVFNFHHRNDTGDVTALVTATEETDTAPTASIFTLYLGNVESQTTELVVPVDGSGQIRFRLSNSASAADIVRITTSGWIDSRGRNA